MAPPTIKREADDPDVEQYRFDEVVSERADQRRRQKCDQYPDDETLRGRILEHAERELPDTEKIDRQQRQDRAELDQHGEGLAEIIVIEAKELLHQEEMPGRGYRHELGQALDDAEDECLEQVEGHDGLRGQDDGTGAAQDRAREIWRLRFSRIINPRATGNGEDCTGCSRALSRGSGAT